MAGRILRMWAKRRIWVAVKEGRQQENESKCVLYAAFGRCSVGLAETW